MSRSELAPTIGQFVITSGFHIKHYVAKPQLNFKLKMQFILVIVLIQLNQSNPNPE
jgi:hypothetical protein